MTRLIMYPATSRHSLLRLGFAFAFVTLASWLGGTATQGALVSWYRTIRKPWFTPPDLAFPIAWTLLFLLMAIAFWRVLRYPSAQPGRQTAIVAFVIQLVLNVSWSFAFFGAQNPAAGLVVVVALFAAIAWTILSFRKVDGLAALMLLPYLAWVGFAAVLNATIVWMNL
jgi:translocator protein